MQECKLIFDIASAAKLMPNFAGKDEEDIDTWIRDCLLVYGIAGLAEELALKTMILALKSQARSWASQALLGKTTTLESSINKIKQRFSNQKKNNSTLSRFISCYKAQTHEQYISPFKYANTLFERNLLHSNY